MINISNSIFNVQDKRIHIGDMVVDASDNDPNAVRMYNAIMDALRGLPAIDVPLRNDSYEEIDE